MAKKQRRPPSRGLPKIVLRTPPGLRDRLRELAKASGRSANAVIVDLLEKAMADRADQKNLQEQLALLWEAVAELQQKSHDHIGELRG